jgi:hypothetical protein
LALFIPEIEQNPHIDFGQSENRARLTSEPRKSARTFERDQTHQGPEPGMIFWKYQTSQQLA